MVETETVARKACHEQFQLVIGTLGDVDAVFGEDVFQIVGNLLKILDCVNLYDEIKVCIYKGFAISCNFVLNSLDIF